jgi:hypothetical protein
MSEETKQKNPHLFCKITGKSRPTTWAYLKDKADRLGVDVDNLINNYVSREAITQLLDGSTVEDIRARYKESPSNEISNDELAYLIRLNSKAKKAAEKFNIETVNVVHVADSVQVEEPKKKAKKGKKKKATEEVPAEEAIAEEMTMPEEAL